MAVCVTSVGGVTYPLCCATCTHWIDMRERSIWDTSPPTEGLCELASGWKSDIFEAITEKKRKPAMLRTSANFACNQWEAIP